MRFYIKQHPCTLNPKLKSLKLKIRKDGLLKVNEALLSVQGLSEHLRIACLPRGEPLSVGQIRDCHLIVYLKSVLQQSEYQSID